MKKNKRINPIKLREGRIARGYTSAKLASEIGVTRQAIYKYEGGSEPKAEIMMKIIEVLKLPLKFFYEESTEYLDIKSTTFYRSYSSAKVITKEQTKMQNRWTYKIYNLIKQYIEFPKLNLPNDMDNYRKEGYYTIEEIEQITTHLREFWGIGLKPIINLTQLLEENGFIIGKRTSVGLDKVDACSEILDNIPFLFIRSEDSSAVRLRFSLAHELGHVILHKYVNEDDFDDKETYKRLEKEANLFAGAFLLPEDSFGMEVMSSNINHLTLLKKRWKVSIQAMAARCFNLDIFTESQKDRVYITLGKKRMKKNEPLDDVLLIEEPIIFKQAINLLLENNIISSSDIFEQLNIYNDEVEQIASLPKGLLKLNKGIVELPKLKIIK